MWQFSTDVKLAAITFETKAMQSAISYMHVRQLFAISITDMQISQNSSNHIHVTPSRIHEMRFREGGNHAVNARFN
jgi:hypothetical protein